RPTVDLPQPDSPTRPNVSPAKISNDTPSTARTTSVEPSTGKCLTRPLTVTSLSARAAATFACSISTRALMNLFVISRNCRCKIVKHATHFDTAVELIQRNLFRRATRHAMRAARREVTTRRQIRRSRHDTFDRLEPFFLYHLRDAELWNRAQQAFRV